MARILPAVAIIAIHMSILTVVASDPASAQEQNPIQIENSRPGTTGWRLSKPSDDLNKQLKGYADKASVDIGESIDFHVSVNRPQAFTIDIYRLGYYGGSGARLMTSIGPLNGTPQSYPPVDPTTGYLEYRWPVSHRLTIPTDWVSGIYVAKLVNADGYDNYIGFVVRNDGRQADLLFQRPILTDHAYNSFPNVDPSTPGFDGSNPAHVGKSLYEFNSGGGNTVAGTKRAVKISMNRPMSGNGVGLLFTWEYDLMQWLERNGYNVTYSTNIETHVDPSRLLDFKGFISPAHDEYWTGEMFTAVERARDAGVGLAFMGANTAYYQIRLDPSADGTLRRSIFTYKSASLDPEPDPAKKTGRFRDIGRPEQALIGIQYVDYGPPERSALVPRNIDHWLFEGTGITTTDVIPGVVGSEIDNYDSRFPLPANSSYTLLAASPYTGVRGQQVQHTSIYQAPGGAWVFASGTLSWSFGLGRPGVTSPVIQRMTRNLFDRFLNGGSGSDPGDIAVVVRLRGSTGEERARLYTDTGQTVWEQVVPSQWTTVSATVPTGARELYVGFVNDAVSALGDRNLRVDSITWTGSGSIVQAESVESKGVWNGTDCAQGFRNSETLACNGWFKFPVPGNVTPPPPPPPPPPVTVRKSPSR